MKKFWFHAMAASVASVTLALGSACMAEGSENARSFACDGDIAGTAALILSKHREGVGDQTKVPASVDGVKKVLAAMRQGDQDIRVLAGTLMGVVGFSRIRRRCGP